MPLMVTPGDFRHRAALYHQLAQFTAAGVGLIRALEQLCRQASLRSERRSLTQVLRQLESGCSFHEALQSVDWLPEFDQALLLAGEQSGRLDATFRLLADYYTDRARIARQMLGDLAYPAFVFHMAVFIFPFAAFFMSGNWVLYLAQTFGVLLPLYGLIWLGIYAGQSGHGETWRGWMERCLRPVPILGTARHYLALSRLSAALEALLSAGVTIIQAWELAARASGSLALRQAVLAWRPNVDAGQTPAEVVSASKQFPEFFATQYATGELSGQLEQTLQRLQQFYQEEGSRKLHAVAQWTPRLAYLMIALLIAFKVVAFWSNYFKQIGAAGGF